MFLFMVMILDGTKCPKIYRKSLLHLCIKYKFAVNFGTLSSSEYAEYGWSN